MGNNKKYVIGSSIIFVVFLCAIILNILGLAGINDTIISIISFAGILVAFLNARKSITNGFLIAIIITIIAGFILCFLALKGFFIDVSPYTIIFSMLGVLSLIFLWLAFIIIKKYRS